MPIVLVTASPSIELTVKAVQRGAFDFLPKPLDEARLVATLSRAVDHVKLLRRVLELESGDGDEAFEGLIGSSPAMRRVFGLIEAVARTDASVMITGESGTGKDMVARAIHRRSPRKAGPLVSLNMAAVPKELVESTLFGHERGAFTGADRTRIGACEEASGGTLFLDEIAEMPIELQPKLLRFLQDHTLRRVGGSVDSTSDVRIVAATNRDPAAEVKAGRLRADLYYRLNVVPIELPPLRDRRGDIALIALHAVRQYARRHCKRFTSIDAEALDRLTANDWPGNIRELRHVMERVVVLNDGEAVTTSMLPAELSDRRLEAMIAACGEQDLLGRGDAIVPLEEIERRAIERAMQLCEDNAARAAERLGISTATIYRKLRAYSPVA